MQLLFLITLFDFLKFSFSAVLDVIPFKGRHTAAKLAYEIGIRLLDMDALLYSGTTDNAPNVVLAMRRLLNDAWQNEDEDDIDDLEESGFHCQDHTLDLAIRTAFAEVDTVMNDILLVRNLVVAVKASTLKQDRLRVIQTILHQKKLIVIQDTPTHWNSIFFMLSQFLEVWFNLSFSFFYFSLKILLTLI